MSDTLRDYTVPGRADNGGRGDVELYCDRCDAVLINDGLNVPLLELVRLATEHSKRCLG